MGIVFHDILDEALGVTISFTPLTDSKLPCTLKGVVSNDTLCLNRYTVKQRTLILTEGILTLNESFTAFNAGCHVSLHPVLLQD